jgi:Mn-dependent DtxR family transcriptional regulator
MVQKLDKRKYLIYEKYRGIKLTSSGHIMGKHLVYKHKILDSFFRIIGVDEDRILEEVEGIEHHFSPKTFDRIIDLVQYFQEDEQRINTLIEIHKKNTK